MVEAGLKNGDTGAGFTKSLFDKGHFKFKDFLEFLPPLKIPSFTKPPSLKETLKTPLISWKLRTYLKLKEVTVKECLITLMNI